MSNRRHFLHQALDELQRMRRHRRPGAMFMLDLDHFKALNDRYGHDAGDKMLVESSSRIRQLLRGHDLFGRMGGEEFAGLLPETDISAAFAVAQRVRESIAAIRLKIADETITRDLQHRPDRDRSGCRHAGTGLEARRCGALQCQAGRTQSRADRVAATQATQSVRPELVEGLRSEVRGRASAPRTVW